MGSILLLLWFAAEIPTSLALKNTPRPANPFLSPSTDPYNPLRYIASNTLTAIAFTLYMTCAFTMSLYMWKRGARWMAPMVIGAYTFSIGLAFRFGLHVSPESKGLYIAEDLFVVLSPCAFIAADYVLLGRLAQHLNMGHYLLIKPQLITRIFIASDLATFLIQATGGGMTISLNPTTSRIGSKIFLTGLSLQLVSFFFFTLLFLLFLYRVRTRSPTVWSPSPRPVWWQDWTVLASALGVSCVGIIIRSAYRTVELSQGFAGHLATTEGFFYGLDTFPLLVAIGVYIPFWPGQFINDKTAVLFKSSERKEEESTASGNVIPY